MDSGAFANNAIVAEPTEFVDSRINDSEAIRSKSGQDGDRKFKSDEPWTVSRGCPSPGTSTSEVGQGIVQKTSQEVKVFYPFHFTLSLCATFKHCQSTVEALSKHCRSTVEALSKHCSQFYVCRTLSTNFSYHFRLLCLYLWS